MFASNYIEAGIKPLKVGDTLEKAVRFFEQHPHLSLAPVVKGNKFAGSLPFSALTLERNLEQSIASLMLPLDEAAVVQNQQPVFDVIKVMLDNDADVIPVLDRTQQYYGIITRNGLLKSLGEVIGVFEPGGIIVLSVDHRDYSLSQIASIIESCDARIVNMFLQPEPDTYKLLVCLKLNISELTRVIMSFERMGYSVVHTFFDQFQVSDTHQRYEALMKFIGM